MECPYCNTKFSCKTSLKHHQETAKYCLKLQGINTKKFVCECCQKNFSTKYRLENHYRSCLSYKKKSIENEFNSEKNKLLEKLSEMKKIIEQKDLCIVNLQNKLENIAIKAVEKTTIDENKYDIGWLEEIMSPEKLDTPYNKLKEENKDFKSQIKYLINKCVKKQPRIQYKEKYVIYVLTTALMKKERRYILGKAKDLTNRLSTYNKSDEHEVIYYQSCGNQETMSCVENMVFEYLKKYREKANRERFILPETEEIELFITAIKKSVDFFNNI